MRNKGRRGPWPDALTRLLAFLLGELTFEIVDRETAMDELRRERERAWAEDSLPTFANAHGCVNCGVIQIKPKNHRCALCGSSYVVSLVKQLDHGPRVVSKRVLQFRKSS